MTLDSNRLPKITLFEGLTPEQLAFVAEHSRERTCRSGVTILSEGEPGESFYVILKGTVRVYASLPNGGQVFLALLAAGDTVGEMSLIDSAGRSADVVSQEATTLLTINRTAFDYLMNTGAFPRNLMRILARRLRLANIHIQAHCKLDVFGMVAFQLIEFSELYGETLPNKDILIPVRLTQQDIADLVGAGRERVNQVMVAYRSNGYLSVDSRYRITIHNLAALQKRVQQSG